MALPHRRQQTQLTNFFQGNNASATSSRKRPRTHQESKSRFGACPLCEISFPFHKLEEHAFHCQGKIVVQPKDHDITPRKTDENPVAKGIDPPTNPKETAPSKKLDENPNKAHPLLQASSARTTPSIPRPLPAKSNNQHPPGLFVYPDFISPEEELQLMCMLDDPTAVPTWKSARFNGQHQGKRWGVHCNLLDRRVDAPEHPLPDLLTRIVADRLPSLSCWKTSTCPLKPNEANAIDYRRRRDDWLQSHVDDRSLSKEPIANLSLVGDCYMTFGSTANPSHSYKVWLPRRCLQILTGPSRYNFTHGIANADLMSDRRVSITLRESPLSSGGGGAGAKATPKINTVFGKQSKRT